MKKKWNGSKDMEVNYGKRGKKEVKKERRERKV